jgi:hypothetical protein
MRVVFPAPSSPRTSTTSPGLSPEAIRAPTCSVSAGLEVPDSLAVRVN